MLNVPFTLELSDCDDREERIKKKDFTVLQKETFFLFQRFSSN